MKFFAEKILEEQRLEKNRAVVNYISLICFIVSIVMVFGLIGLHINRYLKIKNIESMPGTLIINREEWILRPAEDSEKIWMAKLHWTAFTECDSLQIIFNDNNSASLKRDAWHEVFHAGECNKGVLYWNNPLSPKDINDHPGIYHLGYFMRDFSINNPKFLKWESTNN